MEIYVNFNSLEEAHNKCDRLLNEIASVESSFNNITRTLDWDIKSKANIQKYINNLKKEINNAQNNIKSHSYFLKDALDTYLEAERYNEYETSKLKNSLYKDYNSSSGAGGHRPGGSTGGYGPEVGPVDGPGHRPGVGPIPGPGHRPGVGPIPGPGHRPGGIIGLHRPSMGGFRPYVNTQDWFKDMFRYADNLTTALKNLSNKALIDAVNGPLNFSSWRIKNLAGFITKGSSKLNFNIQFSQTLIKVGGVLTSVVTYNASFVYSAGNGKYVENRNVSSQVVSTLQFLSNSTSKLIKYTRQSVTSIASTIYRNILR